MPRSNTQEEVDCNGDLAPFKVGDVVIVTEASGATLIRGDTHIIRRIYLDGNEWLVDTTYRGDRQATGWWAKRFLSVESASRFWTNRPTSEPTKHTQKENPMFSKRKKFELEKPRRQYERKVLGPYDAEQWESSFLGKITSIDGLHDLRFYNRHKLKRNDRETGIKFRVGKWGQMRQYTSCEIECYNLSRELVQKLEEMRGMKQHRGMMSVGTDCTIRGYNPYEIRVSYAVGHYQRLYEVCRLLMTNDVKVNNSCGLHVHFDLTQFNKRRADENWINNQDWIYKLVSQSRRSSSHARQYCMKAHEENRDERYRSLNLCASHSHGTVEVRLHQGTIDPDKIRWWTELCHLVLTSGRTWNNVRDFCHDVTVPLGLRQMTWQRYGALNVISDTPIV